VDVDIPDVLSPIHLLSKELTRKNTLQSSIYPHLVVYNHMCKVFAGYTYIGIYKMLTYGEEIAIVIDNNYYQNTGSREYIAFHVAIVQ